ncbi:MAG: PepSY-associated TM helix domain-containing protein [Betaproteobacteria bacterium]
MPARGRSLWFTLHLWLGLILGLWFALVGATGTLLVYREPLDRWLNPELLTSRGNGPALPAQAIVAAATERFGHVERIRLPAAAGEVYRLQVRTEPGRRVGVYRLEAMFDPATGALLGSRPTEALGLSPPLLLRTLYEFHRNVLLGEPGSNLVGIAGFALLASALSGIALAWPRRRADWARLLRISLRANATRITFDAHRAGGALAALLLVLATITGSTLVYTNYVRDLVGLFSRVESFPTVPWRGAPQDGPAPLGVLIERVQRAYPQHALVEIRMPAGQWTGYEFLLRAAGDIHRHGDTILRVHPTSGEVLVERSDATRSPGEAFMHWLHPLHTGSAFGRGGLLAMAVAGSAPLLLVGTGLWVWLRKRRGEKIGERKRSGRATADPASAR